MNRRYFLFILAILLIVYPASAIDINPFDLGADMVKNGFISFIRSLGEESFSAVGINGNESSMDAYVALSTFTFDPFSFQKVKELNFLSGVIAFMFIMLYLVSGAAWAVLCRTSPNMAMSISEITDIDRDIGGKQYIHNIALSIGALLFGYVIIRFILIFNYVLSSLVAKYTVISTVDISSNFLLYFFSGLVFLVNSIFYTWRLILICTVASFSLVLGAMIIWGYTRGIAISILKYFIEVVFLQLIVIAIITAGMIAIDVAKDFDTLLRILPYTIQLSPLILFVTLLMSVIISLVICLGPLFRPVTKVIVRAVV